MPTYRVYYAERTVGENDPIDDLVTGLPHRRAMRSAEYVAETEWEEEVEAKDKVAALESFFREQIRARSEVMWVDDDDESHAVEGVGDYNPDLTYIWVENEKLMDYQGLDEATPGMVCCPLCDGAGEVDEAVAEEYLAVWSEEIEEA